MSSTTNPSRLQKPTATTTAIGENRQVAQRRSTIEIVLWCIGLIVFIISCFVMHAHPEPFPIDIATTQFVQGLHPSVSWINPVLEFPSILNNPIPSAIALYTWFGFMALVALIYRLRRAMETAVSWFLTALFLLATVMSSAGINVLVDEIVGRPRPNPHTYPVHVYTPIVPFPSYPSGHTEHDVAYYGFLLYLSLVKPVREWKYRWLLLPLQLYAVFDILAIGYSRILVGDHWLTDVLGGYLEGILCLYFFIALYRWTRDWFAKRQAQKAQLTGVNS